MELVFRAPRALSPSLCSALEAATHRVTLHIVGNEQQTGSAGSWETYKPQPSEHPDALLSVCAECGEPFRRQPRDTRGRCYECKPTSGGYPVNQPSRKRKLGTTSARGYDTAWRKLSERARILQPWCDDCGRRDDLTTDHTPAAWERRAAGKPIRLTDVAVVCRRCNSERGAARGKRINHAPARPDYA